MQKLYRILFLAFILNCFYVNVYSQEVDTSITSINADLMNLFNQKSPKKYKIAAINVIGNHYYDENLLVSISGLNVGDEVTIPGGDNFSRAITKIWNQNYFSNIEIYITKLEGRDITVEIDVTERPRLSTFIFRNAKHSETEDLTTKSGLIPGRVVTENMKRTAIDGIIKFYSEKGFKNAKVRVEEKKDTLTHNAVTLIFNIDKGIKVKINNIEFEGNDNVETATLKKQMKGTKEKSRLTLFPADDQGGFIKKKPYTFSDYLKDKGYLYYSTTKKVLDPYARFKFFTSAKFNEKKYIEDKEKIINYYNTQGYRDAILYRDTIVHNKKGDLNIDIKLSEGHKYYFGNISWRGNTKYPDSVLTFVLGIRKGDIYNLETLTKKLNGGADASTADIGGLYMNDGYLFFHANPVETAVYNDTIDYEIRITEGPQATLKNITISGNDKTKEYIIRRELRTIPGDKFSRDFYVRSQRELAQLSFFNPEKVSGDIVPHPEDGTVDINWHVEEKSSDQLELSAGWGGVIGLTGTLGVSFNNFSINRIFHKDAWDPIPMGDGQKLSLRFQSNGKAFRSYNISFTEPWLGGKKRNPLTVSLYDTKFANAYDYATGTYSSANANKAYLRTTGIAVSIGKQLKWPDDYFSGSVGVSFSRYKLVNYPISPIQLPGFENGFSHNLNIKFTIQRAATLGNPMFPSGGSNLMLSLQLTPPYSLFDPGLINTNVAVRYKWIEYHKWRFNTEWYLPLTKGAGAEHNKQLILKAAAKYGFLGRYNSKLQISPFERFQVGDAGMSNQYALVGYDIVSQRGYPVYETSDPRYNPDQSSASRYFTIFNKYTLELRYPLSLNPSSTIYAETFFEAANGWYDIRNYNPFKLRRSVGVGVRFFLPMFGLLGFDYGLGLDRYTPGSGLKDMSRFTFMLGYEPD